jgi:hypothetical protein
MAASRKKIKNSFLTFSLVGLLFIIVYTYLNYRYFRNDDSEGIRCFVFPLVASWVWALAVFILLWRYILPPGKQLNRGAKTVWVLLGMALGFSTTAAQYWMIRKTAGLKQLKGPSLISAPTKELYYGFDHFFVDKSRMRVDGLKKYEKSGRRKYLAYYAWAAAPLCDNKETCMDSAVTVWIAADYSREYSNNLSKEEIDTSWAQFLSESKQRFLTDTLEKCTYLEVQTSTYRSGLTDSLEQYMNKPVVILSPVYQPFENRATGLFWAAIACFLVYEVILMLMFSSMLKDDNGGSIHRF